MNPSDCVWKGLYLVLMKTTLQEKEVMHCIITNLVYKFIPMPQAMKIPAAKAAVDKEWRKQKNISAWKLTKVRNKSDMIDEARKKHVKVHCASLMDICHLKNAELEKKHQDNACSIRRCTTAGSDLTLAFASNLTKVLASRDHHPPTSRANTTRRARAPASTSSV